MKVVVKLVPGAKAELPVSDVLNQGGTHIRKSSVPVREPWAAQSFKTSIPH